MAKTEDMTEEAHKSKKEPKEEVVDTLNEAEEKRREFMRNHRKSAQHYLKKCSALLSRRNKNAYKGLSTFTFNILD